MLNFEQVSADLSKDVDKRCKVCTILLHLIVPVCDLHMTCGSLIILLYLCVHQNVSAAARQSNDDEDDDVESMINLINHNQQRRSRCYLGDEGQPIL